MQETEDVNLRYVLYGGISKMCATILSVTAFFFPHVCTGRGVPIVT